MIPTYRRQYLPADLPAWDRYRQERLNAHLHHGRVISWAWYRFIAKGTLP